MKRDYFGRIHGIRQIGLAAWLVLSLFVYQPVQASDYVIDTKDTHAFILFKISHLGYSWLIGHFTAFEGEFSYDGQSPEHSRLEISIDTASIESFHAERDKHLRGEDYLDSGKYPRARFISESYSEQADGSGVMKGQFTLKGVTRPLQIQTRKIGEGPDPWGDYRLGFEGKTEFKLKDFGIDALLGKAAETIYLELYIEGVRVKSEQRRMKR